MSSTPQLFLGGTRKGIPTGTTPYFQVHVEGGLLYFGVKSPYGETYTRLLPEQALELLEYLETIVVKPNQVVLRERP